MQSHEREESFLNDDYDSGLDSATISSPQGPISFAFSLPSTSADIDWLIDPSAPELCSQSLARFSGTLRYFPSASSAEAAQPFAALTQPSQDSSEPAQRSPASPPSPSFTAPPDSSTPAPLQPDPRRLKHRAVDAKRRDRENAALSELQRLIRLVDEDDHKGLPTPRQQSTTSSNKHKWKRFVMEGAARALQHTHQQSQLLKQLLLAEQQQRMQERIAQQQAYLGVVTTLQGAPHNGRRVGAHDRVYVLLTHSPAVVPRDPVCSPPTQHG